MKVEFTINFRIPKWNFVGTSTGASIELKKGEQLVTARFIKDWQIIIADNYKKFGCRPNDVLITEVLY